MGGSSSAVQNSSLGGGHGSQIGALIVNICGNKTGKNAGKVGDGFRRMCDKILDI